MPVLVSRAGQVLRQKISHKGLIFTVPHCPICLAPYPSPWGRCTVDNRREVYVSASIAQSWSDMPGTVAIWRARDGWLVKYRSRIFFSRVASLLSWTRLCSARDSRKASQASLLTFPGWVKQLVQAMSLKLWSPLKILWSREDTIFLDFRQFIIIKFYLFLGVTTRLSIKGIYKQFPPL